MQLPSRSLYLLLHHRIRMQLLLLPFHLQLLVVQTRRSLPALRILKRIKSSSQMELRSRMSSSSRSNTKTPLQKRHHNISRRRSSKRSSLLMSSRSLRQ